MTWFFFGGFRERHFGPRADRRRRDDDGGGIGGDTDTVAKSVTMTNIIGADIRDAYAQLDTADTHLHDYGKAEVRAGRKMGHVTRLVR